MDRNRHYCCWRSRHSRVALRKESVDRNPVVAGSLTMIGGSLSARRAWIEIRLTDMSNAWHRLSLSARRAWIEICYLDNIEISEASRSPQGERG